MGKWTDSKASKRRDNEKHIFMYHQYSKRTGKARASDTAGNGEIGMEAF